MGDELIKPTKIYVDCILPLIQKRMIKSIAHITGGGIYENLARALPRKITAMINLKNKQQTIRYKNKPTSWAFPLGWLPWIDIINSQNMADLFV